MSVSRKKLSESATKTLLAVRSAGDGGADYYKLARGGGSTASAASLVAKGLLLRSEAKGGFALWTLSPDGEAVASAVKAVSTSQDFLWDWVGDRWDRFHYREDVSLPQLALANLAEAFSYAAVRPSTGDKITASWFRMANCLRAATMHKEASVAAG